MFLTFRGPLASHDSGPYSSRTALLPKLVGDFFLDFREGHCAGNFAGSLRDGFGRTN